MIAETLMSDIITPIRKSDKGETALEAMNDFYVRHLPVVNDTVLVGILSEDDILNHDILQIVDYYKFSLPRVAVQTTAHLYEVMKLMADFNLTIIPVVDKKQNYIGLISMEDVLLHFAKTLPFTEPGSILVLAMPKIDYVLSEISRIIESENAIILSSTVALGADDTMIEVTLKLNTLHTHSIISTLERFDYTIKAAYSEEELVDILEERYASLMTYLNV